MNAAAFSQRFPPLPHATSRRLVSAPPHCRSKQARKEARPSLQLNNDDSESVSQQEADLISSPPLFIFATHTMQIKVTMTQVDSRK